MKKKVLISTCVLAACLGACNNDEFLVEQPAMGNTDAANGTVVVGADLASKGLNIIVGEEGVDTRAGAGTWDSMDRIGLAWYNFSTAGINGIQNESDWGSANWTNWLDGTAGKTRDNKIYANHILEGQTDGSFTTTADIYQGAYFLYFPFAKQPTEQGTVAKTIKVNAEAQTGDFDTEKWNKGLRLSAQDFIAAGEGVEDTEDVNTYTMTKQFAMSPVVNVLRVEVAPDAKITDAEDGTDGAFLKGLNVTKLDIDVNKTGVAPFVTEAELAPSYIPRVERVERDATNAILWSDTYESLKEKAESQEILATGTTKKTSDVLTTTVENAAYTLAENREVRAFAFPIIDAITYAANEAPNATVTIGKVDENGKELYPLGEFAITAGNNDKFITKLAGNLTTELKKLQVRVNAETNATVWDNVSYINDNAAQLVLTKDDFTPLTSDIKSEDQWNDLVKLYDALVDLEVIDPEDYETPVFTLTEDVTFEGKTIATPKEIDIELQTASGKRMRLDNTEGINWPANLKTNNNAQIVVVSGTKLNVGLDGKEVVINATISNQENSVINAGPLASIGAQNGGKVSNRGRVIIKYGAYVYPNSNVGVIAYVKETNEAVEIRNINKLVQLTDDDTQAEYANVNTLIIPEGIELDLNAKIDATLGDDDRYEGVVGGSDEVELEDLDGVNIELEGGTLISKSTEKKVNNVTAVSGTSTITDVDVVGDITTKADAILNVESDNTPTKYTFDLVDINNYGTLNVNSDMTVEIVNNYKGGDITVADGYSIIYSVRGNDGYLQEGTADGVIAEVGAADTAEAKAVESSFDALVAGWKAESTACSTVAEFVTAFKAISNWESANLAKAFLEDLNEWRAEYNYPSIVSYTDLTETDLLIFINTTGIQLFETGE